MGEVISPTGVIVNAGEPYVDKGTRAYPGPPAEVAYGQEHDPNPTGLVPGPPVEVTVESPPAPKKEKAKAVKAADVEDKAVKGPRTKEGA